MITSGAGIIADARDGGANGGGGEKTAILITGGAGYIGSHCCIELLREGPLEVVIVDNLCNAHPSAISRIMEVAGRPVKFHQIDLLDLPALQALFAQYGGFAAVLHFAGLKAVGESHERPLEYYQNNLQGSLNLFQCMVATDTCRLIYSSSATVYGDPAVYPMDEGCRTGPTSPYGHSKLFLEQIIADASRRHGWQSIILRYFNPVGAHPSGRIGEHPQGVPNNLMPYLAQVAVGQRPYVTIHGADYFTRDGTGVRDYIHVVDLCRGHLCALQALSALPPGRCEIYNLGTGVGYTVLEMVQTFGRVNGLELPYQVGPRRAGDVATLLADPAKAQQQLGWTARLTLGDMCRDLWRWQAANPQGFDTPPANKQD